MSSFFPRGVVADEKAKVRKALTVACEAALDELRMDTCDVHAVAHVLRARSLDALSRMELAYSAASTRVQEQAKH